MGPDNRSLDLDWLEDFVALAETGNFSRAAEARCIAQPAFSRHIRSLEEWVGIDLIDRGTHPVELNGAGRTFLPFVRDSLAALQAARIKARLVHDQSAASLRFAVTHALSITFFPRWLGALEANLQHGPVQTLSNHSRACEDLMIQRRVQFVLCYGHSDVPGRLDEGRYPVVCLGTDVALPVAAADASGQALFELGRGELMPVLDYSDASGLGRILRARFAKDSERASDVTVVFTAHSAFLLKTMALAGRGIAWLPKSLVSEELANGRLVAAGSAALRVPLEVRLYRQNAVMAPTAEALWGLVCKESAAIHEP
jgi:LysR family transcriptional regulator, hypochlorite-specific transcription factor HypT